MLAGHIDVIGVDAPTGCRELSQTTKFRQHSDRSRVATRFGRGDPHFGVFIGFLGNRFTCRKLFVMFSKPLSDNKAF